MVMLSTFCTNLWRKKTVVTSSLHETKLKRCLGLLDVVGLGLGSSLGVGVYIITSYSISQEAGPSFVISVILAGVATLIAGLCYAEFSSRLPKAGSAYLYTYVTLGELCGFVIGWNMILEHVITSSIAAKAWSQYFDFMLNGTIKNFIQENMPWKKSVVVDEIPDFVAFTITIVATILLTLKIKVSSVILIAFTFVNLLIIICFVCIGYFHVRHDNWTDPPGFFAHGFTGVLSGASTLIFTFTSIEVITSATEETKEPSKITPTAITYSVFISSIVFFCISTAASLSLHHFPADSLVALPVVLRNLHIHGAGFVIAVGGLLGLTASLLGNIYYVSRLTYAQACDKLLFGSVNVISDKTQSPVICVLITGFVSSVVALVIDFKLLLQIVSIGTLLAYTLVAIAVICLRYQSGLVGFYKEYEDPDNISYMQCTDLTYAGGVQNTSSNQQYYQNMQRKQLSNQTPLFNQFDKIPDYTNGYKTRSFVRKSMSFDERLSKYGNNNKNVPRPRDSTYTRFDSVISNTSNGSVTGLLNLPPDIPVDPNESTWRSAATGLLVFIIVTCIMSTVISYSELILETESWWILLIVFAFCVVLIAATVVIAKQPENRTKLYFKTPYIPFVPLLGIFINIFLLTSLSAACWIRFLVWMSIGLIVYALYGYSHSLEHQTDEQEVVLYEITDETQGTS